jgi:hypothetical protein
VEFPPSFPYRLSQQECVLLAPQHNAHDAMDIGHYCVGALPSLCVSQVQQPSQLVESRSRAPAIPNTQTAASERAIHAAAPNLLHAVDSAAEVGCEVDGSARKRRRTTAARNFGESVIFLLRILCCFWS